MFKTRKDEERRCVPLTWRDVLSLVLLASFLSVIWGMCLMVTIEDAFAATSAEQKGQEYAQQDPGYEAAQQASGSTQYFLDIEEPEPEKTPIDTTGLPKTGDSAESRLVLMIFGGMGVLAITGLCVAFWPRKLEDDEEPEEDPFDDPLEDDDF
ncbi:MAG: hypothetical protein ACI36V_02960 [Coriobacteriales bacterium]